MTLEPIFIAANTREAERVEHLLEDEGIEYSVRPEAFVRSTSGPCFQGLMFEVLPGQADFCRKMLAANGLKAGIQH